MCVASQMRRWQRIFTFIFLASLFKAGNLTVLELAGAFQFAALFVLIRQGGVEFNVGGKGTLQAKNEVTDT